MTAYGRVSREKTTDEEAIRHHVQEKKQKRAKQLAEVEARRKILYHNFKGKHRLKTANGIDILA